MTALQTSVLLLLIFCIREYFFHIKYYLFAACKSQDKYGQSLRCISSAPLVLSNPQTPLLSNIKQQPRNINM